MRGGQEGGIAKRTAARLLSGLKFGEGMCHPLENHVEPWMAYAETILLMEASKIQTVSPPQVSLKPSPLAPGPEFPIGCCLFPLTSAVGFHVAARFMPAARFISSPRIYESFGLYIVEVNWDGEREGMLIQCLPGQQFLTQQHYCWLQRFARRLWSLQYVVSNTSKPAAHGSWRPPRTSN